MIVGRYLVGEVNHCPGCGRSHWLIGRVSAECAFCATAVPISTPERGLAPVIRRMGKGGGKISRMASAA